MTSIESDKRKKRLLRNNEYYDIQQEYDKLYADSKKNKVFKHLMKLITDERNIQLAYRNIKKNSGSRTPGVNGKTIEHIEKLTTDELVSYVRNRLSNFKPMMVKFKEIPKPNGDMRPLGIPTIEDRLIQQCIKQVLEPIAEAKFHPHSYGFRPNRSTDHAIARNNKLINMSKLHYVVDIDIKGFFDNVNHAKLLKQLWTLGIQDKNLICVISKLLKAEIEGKGIPEKGTPQGGILSPLLSNIVLNELDWWISDQWETFETKHDYTRDIKGRGKSQGHKYRALRDTGMKEMYLIRYADDFKIMCRNYKDAQKIFIATKKWLKERLNLEISKDKSNNTRNKGSTKGVKNKAYKKFYEKFNFKTIYVSGIPLYPIQGVSYRNPLFFTQEVCNYTELGRSLIHNKLTQVRMEVLRYIMLNPVKGKSEEYNDNRISLYCGQQGVCGITKEPLEIDNMEVHHIKMISDGGTDEYSNLIFVIKPVHKLIHATNNEVIEYYRKILDLSDSSLKKINKLRKIVGNAVI